MTLSRPTGFASPAEGAMDSSLDFNKLLIQRPAATFVLRAQGDGLAKLKLNQNDLLIVDRSLTPRSGDLIICTIEGELKIRRYFAKKNKIYLYPSLPFNEAEFSTETDNSDEFTVWGVITYIIYQQRETA